LFGEVAVPVHDWTCVEAGIFHHFHLEWIGEIARTLNRGLLPPGYFALAEQIAGGRELHVLTLKGPAQGGQPEARPPGGITLAAAPPKVHHHAKTEAGAYASKTKAIAIRHTSHHQLIAFVEVVSPGNENTRHGLRAFVEKAAETLRAGIHLVVVDLFPPGPRDPEGIHKAIWDEIIANDFTLPPGRPLTLASYVGGPCPEAFVEPVAVGASLPDMPLFLTPEVYVPFPLEKTYTSAWEAVPTFWQDVLTAP
jgi:hypothetical protein